MQSSLIFRSLPSIPLIAQISSRCTAQEGQKAEGDPGNAGTEQRRRHVKEVVLLVLLANPRWEKDGRTEGREEERWSGEGHKGELPPQVTASLLAMGIEEGATLDLDGSLVGRGGESQRWRGNG
jgi:hypothetical protein